MGNLKEIYQQLVKQVEEKGPFQRNLGYITLFVNFVKTSWISGIDIDEKINAKI